MTMNLSNKPLNDYTSTHKPMLRKSTSKALLSSTISIPRVRSYPCDQCGHRMSRVGSYHEAYEEDAQGSYRLSRPHSLYADRDNYVNFHQMDFNYINKPKKKENNRKSRKPENVYEDISDENHMRTMDIRIKVTADIIKDSDGFIKPVAETKADNELRLYDSCADISTKMRDKPNIFSKVNHFKKTCLARMKTLLVT
eukprot:GFUD01020331.1.p1 GENE.GFUD01020331.1~~GFUD01020331.1.p1  ORF type:complete len:197 (+),score=56.79 GFUD01020331.1:114-704(+)